MTTAARLSRRLRLAALLPLALVLALAAPLLGQAVLEKGDRVAVVGDSITEQKQYSRFIEDYLTVCMPQLDLSVVQLGWSGETAGGFERRMDQDLFPFKPNVITTCYGMNDGRYRAFDESIGKAYREPMERIVRAAKAHGATVVVGSPGVVDSKTWRGDAAVYNDNLASLRDIARDIAKAEGMPFANVHDAMMDAMKKGKAALGDDYHVGGGDGVHPSANGQLVMAYAFLKGLGCDGRLGTITVDLAGASSAEGGHKVLSSEGGKVEIESTRYPFCFWGDEKAPDSTRSVLPFIPFNQDLNRLTLVVKGAGGKGAKVTWGGATKSFTAAQLAEGVNLAAEFLDNPFCEPFGKVDKAVAAKQNFETFMIKQAYHFLGDLGRNIGDDAAAKAAAETLRERMHARHAELAKAVRDAFVPVRHTLVVTAE
jgi:lysophospholipase L1-like esterase